MHLKIILNLILVLVATNTVLSKKDVHGGFVIANNKFTHYKKVHSISDTITNSLIGKWIGNPIIYQYKEFTVSFGADNLFNLVEYNTETKKRKSLTGPQKRSDGSIVQLQLKYAPVMNQPTFNLLLTPVIDGVEFEKKMYAKYSLLNTTTMKLVLLFDDSTATSNAEEIILRKQN
jgi:hypothetical protein